jgi:hypothetical protein
MHSPLFVSKLSMDRWLPRSSAGNDAAARSTLRVSILDALHESAFLNSVPQNSSACLQNRSTVVAISACREGAVYFPGFRRRTLHHRSKEQTWMAAVWVRTQSTGLDGIEDEKSTLAVGRLKSRDQVVAPALANLFLLLGYLTARTFFNSRMQERGKVTMDPRIRSIEVMDDRVAEILRRKSSAERIAIADGMWRFAREMIYAIVTREHPDWSNDEIQRQVARRMSHGAI